MHYTAFISAVLALASATSAADLLPIKASDIPVRNDNNTLFSGVPTQLSDLYKTVPTCAQSCVQGVIGDEKELIPCLTGGKDLATMAKCACEKIDLQRFTTNGYLETCIEEAEKDEGDDDDTETCDTDVAEAAIRQLVTWCESLGVSAKDGDAKDSIVDLPVIAPNATNGTATIRPGKNGTTTTDINTSTPTQPVEDDNEDDKNEDDDKDSGSVSFTVSSMMMGLGIFASVAFAL